MYNCNTLSKEETLMHLFNNAKPQGMGFLHFKSENMTLEKAEELLSHTDYFDYVEGRVMKIDFSNFPEMDFWLYNRDNNKPAEEILDNLQNNTQV